jgi:hypothetical protein
MIEETSHFCILGYVTISSFVHVIIGVENMHFYIGERFHRDDSINISYTQKPFGLVNCHTQHLHNNASLHKCCRHT